VDGSGDFQSMIIKATLTGRISNRWVYWSSRRASANEDVRALHHVATEIAVRNENVSLGGNRKIDGRPEVLSTVSLPWLALPRVSILFYYWL
jgi:hypothetical protein